MNIASFGNFMGVDSLLIFVVILLIFGAKRLPELAKGLGQAIREFSKAKDEVHNEITRPPSPELQKLEEHKTESDSQTHDSHTRVV